MLLRLDRKYYNIRGSLEEKIEKTVIVDLATDFRFECVKVAPEFGHCEDKDASIKRNG